MSSKITIIGAGSVGSTIAYNLSNNDLASEIVLIDINKEKVEGEVMDIVQGTSFRNPISIVAGDYEDAKDSDIVIITSGIARKPGQTRIELTQTNVNILKSITPQCPLYYCKQSGGYHDLCIHQDLWTSGKPDHRFRNSSGHSKTSFWPLRAFRGGSEKYSRLCIR